MEVGTPQIYIIHIINKVIYSWSNTWTRIRSFFIQQVIVTPLIHSLSRLAAAYEHSFHSVKYS